MASVQTIELKVDASDLIVKIDELLAAIKGFTPPASNPASDTSAASSLAATSTPDAAPAASSPEKPAPVAKTEAPTSQAAETTPAAATQSTPPDAVSLKHIQELITGILKATPAKKPRAAAILAEFNAKNATQIKEADYVAVHAKLAELKAAAE